MIRKDIPVVILAGGLGTRLREETEFRPKPMVPVGGRPMLWHIMKIYAHYGFYRFIICLGYKGEMIKHYFSNYHLNDIDITVDTSTGAVIQHQKNQEEWLITLVNTGQDCMTGGRIARVAHYIDTPQFMLTYGDGVSNVDLDALLAFHNQQKKMVTITGVNLPSRFGHFRVQDDQVQEFVEKKNVEHEWINGGFFVCQKEFLNYIDDDANCVLEQEPLRAVTEQGQLGLYKHKGFWQCMDTVREHQMLEELWKKDAPWKVWQEQSFTPATKQPGEAYSVQRGHDAIKGPRTIYEQGV